MFDLERQNMKDTAAFNAEQRRNNEKKEIFSSGFAYYKCTLDHETVQYFINQINMIMVCPVCDESACFDHALIKDKFGVYREEPGGK